MTLRGQIDSTTSYRTEAFNLTNQIVPANWNVGGGGIGAPYIPNYMSKTRSRINLTSTPMVDI